MELKSNKNSIFKSGLKRKTLLLTGILMLVVVVIQFILSFIFLNTAFNQNIANVKQGFDNIIKTAVETVISELEINYQLYIDGIISEETAMILSKKIVRDTRYSSGAGKIDDGYFWADMADGLCIANYNPENEDKMRLDWKDQEGTYYIQNFIALGDSGGGYSDYYFGKPGDESGSYKKRGYTLKFEPYGWYISTGNYYEDIDQVILEFENLKNTYLLMLFVASLLIAGIGVYLVARNLNHVVVHIIKISNRLHQLSMGDTSVDSLDTADEDEIGDLNESILRVVSILNKLISGISNMIYEHERGNIDFSFDTEEFFGEYRTLADSVLELASFGMKDQLTGIPNRRSLDNRLHMEWQRAIRDKTSISFFMIDIDKFKTYNDKFGHQQGDVALRAVAQTVRQSLKRSIDFAARWGGEEFVVLLPSTDSNGALTVAEKIRAAVENTKIPCNEENGTNVTISIGICSIIPEPDEEVSNFIGKADTALYKAKESGRNKVVLMRD